jgi:hypothetical protein
MIINGHMRVPQVEEESESDVIMNDYIHPDVELSLPMIQEFYDFDDQHVQYLLLMIIIIN